MNIEEQAALFSALSDPTRLRLLQILSRQQPQGALCVNGLAFRLGVTQPAVSQHLKVLKDIGLVKGERMGYRVHYYIDREKLEEIRGLAAEALRLDAPNEENVELPCCGEPAESPQPSKEEHHDLQQY